MIYIVLVALIALITLTVLTPFFMKWLAEENILFTTCKEGTVKAIMRAKTFERFIMAFDGYHLNDPRKKWYNPDLPDWEVIFHDKKDDATYEDRFWILKHLGLYWVGWPWANNVYVYVFNWNETCTTDSGEEKIVVRTEATDFIYVADFTYAIVTTGAETSENLQTTELTLVTIAVRNPYRALFFGEDWMRRVSAAINRHIREYVGNKKFADLRSTSKESGGDTAFSAPIMALNDRLPDDDLDGSKNRHKGLAERYGVKIRTADLQTVTLVGEAQKIHEEATTREYTSIQEAVAIRNVGQAHAEVIKMRGDTEAEALAKRLKVITEHGEVGIQLAGYDAIQESSKGPGNTIIWANNPLGALAPLAKKLPFPGNKEGEIV